MTTHSSPLLDFGLLPVSGYLCDTQEEAFLQPQIPHSLSIDLTSSLVHQCYPDGRELLTRKVYSEYQHTYSNSGTLDSYMSSFVSFIMERCNLNTGDSILEIGSNNGKVLSLLSKQGYSCFGIDPSSPSVDTKDLSLHKGFFDISYVRSFSLENKFRCIFSRHTLEHVYSPLEFLKAAELSLHDNGKIFIEVPYLPMQINRNHFEGMQVQHESFFSVSSLSMLVQSVGLFIEDLRFVSLDGGSVIITIARSNPTPIVPAYLEIERRQGIADGSAVSAYAEQLSTSVSSFQEFLASIISQGKSIAAYGAGSKGSFICNYLNLSQYIDVVYDDVQVQSSIKYLPACGLKVVNPRYYLDTSPDFILITAPTLFHEVASSARSVFSKTTILSTSPLMGIAEDCF